MPSFRPDPDMFDKLYRGEAAFDGGPTPTGIPWDVRQAQPRLMELEALGGITGEVLDIGCGLGDNSIFLASQGYSVTGLDGSAAAIEQASSRAADAGGNGELRCRRRHEPHRLRRPVRHRCRQRALSLPGRRGPSGIRRRSVPGNAARCALAPLLLLRRQCQPDRRTAGRGACVEHPRHPDRERLADQLPRPTTYLATTAGFMGDVDEMPEQYRAGLGPEALEQLRDTNARFATISGLLDDDRVHLPFTVVHATRVD